MAVVNIQNSTNANPQKAIKRTKFGIGDARFIQQVLRSDVYSNKPRIIIQEYLSNARDAHREANKAFTPVEIKLPTPNDNELTIRDYGLGVSPERFETVFVQYGTSTKRDSDRQTGGFGIGAKSAWAYTDEYFVTSWTQEGNIMMERRYRCYVANDGWCYGDLEYENVNNKAEQGTQISLTIKDEDCQKFLDTFHNVTYFWGFRPTVLNTTFKYLQWDELARGDSWTLYDHYNGIRNGAVAIIDGIPYPVMPEELGELSDKEKELCRLPIHFHADTGEVNIALSRESLTYNEKTISYLKGKLNEVLVDMSNQIENDLKNCENFWLAQTSWYENYANTTVGSIIKHVMWRGVEVGHGKIRQTDSLHCKMHKVTISNLDQTKPLIRMRKYELWEFRDDVRIVVNDTEKSPSPNRLISVFGDNPNYKTFYVVTFNRENTEGVDIKKRWMDDFHLKEMDPLFTSDFESWKPPKDYKLPKVRKKLSIKKSYSRASPKPSGDIQYVSSSIDVDVELDNIDGYYIKTIRGIPYINEESVELREISCGLYNLFPNDTVYLVPKPLWNKVSRESKLNLFDSEYEQRKKEYNLSIDIDKLQKIKFSYQNDIFQTKKYESIVNVIGSLDLLPSNHPLQKWYDVSLDLNNKKIETQTKINNYVVITKKELTIPTEGITLLENMVNFIENKYPLLKLIGGSSYWRLKINIEQAHDFIKYIELIDGETYK